MNMNIDKDIIRKLRLEKSWSQEKLAEEANINLRTIQRIEKSGTASLQSCTSISKAFGVEPIDLSLDSELQISPSLYFSPEIAPALLINSIVFILWGLSQIVTNLVNLSSYQDSMISFLFFFFAGVVLLAFLTPIANRRYFGIFACFIIAMVLTPPNLIAQVLIALPLWLLFELSLLLARRFKVY